jgi:hypothetical protein
METSFVNNLKEVTENKTRVRARMALTATYLNKDKDKKDIEGDVYS